jgi:hypothetical protein
MAAVVALVLYGVWIAVAFGVRTMWQLRRTGDTGLRMTDDQATEPAAP